LLEQLARLAHSKLPKRAVSHLVVWFVAETKLRPCFRPAALMFSSCTQN
jgi:hypothetical protein